MALEQYDPTALDAAMSEYSKAVAASNAAELATEAAETKVENANVELSAALSSEGTVDTELSAALVILIEEAKKAEATLVESKQNPA